MPTRILCLGGGSGFFSSALQEIALTPELDGSHVILFDRTQKAMDNVAAQARRVAKAVDRKLTIETTTSKAKAFDGVDYCISSIGVHGPRRRDHLRDIRVCRKHGILHTTGDTAGPSAISIALRIVPIYIDYGRELVKRSPGVVFLQHSNPMAVIDRALLKYTDLKVVVGLCHGVQGTYRYLADCLGVPYEQLRARSAGLNHTLWLQSLRHKGKNLMPRLRRLAVKHRDDDKFRFAWELYEIFGHFPINADRHTIELFQYLRQARTEKSLPYGLVGRETLIRDSMKASAKAERKRKASVKKAEPFEPPKERSPENIAELIAAVEAARPEVRILNVQNQGAIPNMPDFANVEVEAVLERDKVRPLAMDPLPDNVVGLQILRAYQYELMVDAAVKRSRRLALQAMASDPLILSLNEAKSLLDDLCGAHKIKLR
jgi:alpha-galactosidase